MSDKNEKKAPEKKTGKKPFPFSKTRGVVALVVVLVVILGLALRLGSGTPSVFGIDKIAAICPLGALEIQLGAHQFMLHPLILLVIVVVIVLFVGKAFCSWMCPVPWLQKFFRGGKKKKKKKGAKGEAEAEAEIEAAEGGDVTVVEAEIVEEEEKPAHSCSSCKGCESLKALGGKRDGLHLDSRHAVLLGTLASAAIFGFPVFCLICPVGLTFATIIAIWNTFQFNDPSWGLLIAPVIIILEVVFLRKWCHKFCPISALISLISAGNKTLKPKVDTNACARSNGTDCHVCVDVCPEKVDPHTKMIPECSKCGACVESCPAQAIKIKFI